MSKKLECRVQNHPQGQESDWCQTFHLLQKTPNENEQYIQRQRISTRNLHLSKPVSGPNRGMIGCICTQTIPHVHSG